MKRPLLVIAIGYIIGIVWGLYCNCSIALLYAIIFLIYVITKIKDKQKGKFKLISIKRYFRYIKIIFNFNVVITIIISSLISNIIIKNLNNKYDSLYSNIQENVEIVGVIISNKEEKEYKDVYKIKVETVNGNSKYKNTYLILNISNKYKTKIEYGDKVKIIGNYEEPSTQRNYKGFNYKEYLKTKKIYGIVKASKVEVMDKDCTNLLLTYANKAFLKIKQNAEEIFSKDKANLFLGIMVGYTKNLDEDIKQSFQNSNISHVLAVSGMHINYILLYINLVGKNKVGKRKIKIILIIILVMYMCITGFSPSVVRATIMTIIVLFSGIVYRKSDIWTSIAISILVILVYNPYLINSVSVSLSYLGTIGAIVFNKQVKTFLLEIKVKNRRLKYRINKKMRKTINKLKEILAITISIQIMIAPIILIYFNTVGIAFLITNVLVSFIIGPIIFLGFICLLVSLVSTKLLKVCSYVLNPMLDLLILISKLGNNLPLSKIYLATPNIIEIIIYYSIVFILNFLYKVHICKNPNAFYIRVKNLTSLFKYKFRINKRKILVVTLIICVIFSVIKIVPKNLNIYFVDVGQGDCTLIKTPNNKTILIDGGGSLNDEYDVGKDVLLPYLLDRRILKVDYILLSHADEDHINGLFTVLENLKVKNIVVAKQLEEYETQKNFLQLAKEKRVNIIVVEAGDKLTIDKDVYFKILWPDSKQMIVDNGINNNSMVAKLIYKNFSMLFTGDIEEKAEKKIVDLYKNTNILQSTIIKTPHHGSKTSSTQAFLKEVQPQIALIGVGKNNLYNHPSKQTIDKMEQSNVQIYRTDEDGEIAICVNNKGIYKINKKLI